MQVAEAVRVDVSPGQQRAFAALARESYLSLTTFRRDGTPVATPVWVVSDDGARLLVETGVTTGKVKRLRNNPKVRVAACSSRGVIHGPIFDAEASLMDDTALVEQLTKRKYRIAAPAIRTMNAVLRFVRRRPKALSLTVVITLPEP